RQRPPRTTRRARAPRRSRAGSRGTTPRSAPSRLPAVRGARWPPLTRPGYDVGPGPPPRPRAVKRIGAGELRTGRGNRINSSNGRRTSVGRVMVMGFATRSRSRDVLILGLGLMCAALWAGDVAAQDAGRVKTVKGTVYIERAGQREVALVGSGVRQADTL